MQIDNYNKLSFHWPRRVIHRCASFTRCRQSVRKRTILQSVFNAKAISIERGYYLLVYKWAYSNNVFLIWFWRVVLFRRIAPHWSCIVSLDNIIKSNSLRVLYICLQSASLLFQLSVQALADFSLVLDFVTVIWKLINNLNFKNIPFLMQSLLSRGFDPRPAQRDIRFTWNLISFITIYQKLLTLQFYKN